MKKLTELEHWKQQLQEEAHTLIDFFCEDKETMKLDECLQIFRDFCVRFNKAVKVWLVTSLCSLSCLGFLFLFFLTQPSAHNRMMAQHFWGFRKVGPRQPCQALDGDEWEVALSFQPQALPYHQDSSSWLPHTKHSLSSPNSIWLVRFIYDGTHSITKSLGRSQISFSPPFPGEYILFQETFVTVG